MIDICMALDQPVFSADSPLPFSVQGSAAKTLIAHRDNTASYAGYVVSGGGILSCFGVILR